MDTTVNLEPQVPPPAVMAAIAAAWDTFDRLEAEDRRLHFRLRREQPGVVIELRDLADQVVSTVTASDALALANTQPDANAASSSSAKRTT